MNHQPTPEQILSSNAEKSRQYHLWLQTYDAAIRALEDNMAALTVAEYNYRWLGLQHDRSALVAEWEREQARC